METFEQINISKAKEILKTKESILIDIRAKEDFEHDHDPLALNLTKEIVDELIISTPKNMPLLFLCYHGISSQNAAQYFCEQGFNEVYSIEGGYEEWKKYK